MYPVRPTLQYPVCTLEKSLRKYPVSHVPAQMAAPSLVHAAPVAGEPLVHVHSFAVQTPSPLRVYPASHDAQMAPPSLVHAAPVAGEPLAHVHVFATHCWNVP